MGLRPEIVRLIEHGPLVSPLNKRYWTKERVQTQQDLILAVTPPLTAEERDAVADLLLAGPPHQPVFRFVSRLIDLIEAGPRDVLWPHHSIHTSWLEPVLRGNDIDG